MDSYSVNDFETEQIIEKLEQLEKLMNVFLDLLISIRKFLDYHSSKQLEENESLSQSHSELFSCFANLTMKSIICLK